MNEISCVLPVVTMRNKDPFLSNLHVSKRVLFRVFADDMVEKMRPEVTLHDVDGVALRQLIEYSYTGEILITEDNVQVLLPASSLLQMEPVREACCRFLLRQLHPSNCLGIRSFAVLTLGLLQREPAPSGLEAPPHGCL
ncbi:hypothetical protein FOCC_FOCC016367 [Frankliniella occidentalis]|nr:hypothetical protein FOCC_FOCC016367 [Frankliniella occidentalis]